MAWVLKIDKHYLDGTTATHYHKGFPLGIMHENVLRPEEAQQFKTKKDAVQYRKDRGMAMYEPVKLA